MLVEQCSTLRFFQAVKLVDYWCHRTDTQAAEADADRKRQGVHLHASPTFAGTVVINGVLDPVGGAVVVAELARLEHQLYLADQHADIVRTKAQRLAAALVEMAQRSAATPETARRPKPLFTVLLGDDTFTGLCELANGTVITPGTLTPWLTTAEMETILFDEPTTVISVSSRRNFCGAVRRAVEVRDRHCQHSSGCDVTVEGCDVNHTVPHVEGGETSHFNGRLECTPHNRHPDKHDHGAQPHPTPARPIDRLDELRARLRWKHLHEDTDNGDDETDDDGDHGDAGIEDADDLGGQESGRDSSP